MIFVSYYLAVDAGLAQLVEHLIRNEGVVGSSPITGTTDFHRSKALALRSLGEVARAENRVSRRSAFAIATARFGAGGQLSTIFANFTITSFFDKIIHTRQRISDGTGFFE